LKDEARKLLAVVFGISGPVAERMSYWLERGDYVILIKE
jgi:hypothetical protein